MKPYNVEFEFFSDNNKVINSMIIYANDEDEVRLKAIVEAGVKGFVDFNIIAIKKYDIIAYFIR